MRVAAPRFALLLLLASPAALAQADGGTPSKKVQASRPKKAAAEKAPPPQDAAPAEPLQLPTLPIDPWIDRNREPPANPPFTWDIPGVTEGVEVPDTYEVQGMPVRMRAVHSTWKIDDLLGHILDSFAKAGLYVPGPDDQLTAQRGYVLTGLDVDRYISYTAYLQPEGKGTLVVMGESDPTKVKPPDTSLGFAPTFPGAQDLLVTRSESSQLATYTAPASPAEVLEFYRSTLARGGYTEVEPGLFRSPGTLLRVTAATLKDGRNATAVKVMASRDESLPAP